jgi:hypothetical protein
MVGTAKVFLAIDALLGVLFLSVSYTSVLQCADLTITILSRLVSLIVSIVLIYKHRAHGAELIQLLQSLFQKK